MDDQIEQLIIDTANILNNIYGDLEELILGNDYHAMSIINNFISIMLPNIPPQDE